MALTDREEKPGISDAKPIRSGKDGDTRVRALPGRLCPVCGGIVRVKFGDQPNQYRFECEDCGRRRTIS